MSVFIVEAQQFIVDDDDITRSVELSEVKSVLFNSVC